jgi:hypothetical protein
MDEITADLVAAMTETPAFGEPTAASRLRADRQQADRQRGGHGATGSGGVLGAARTWQVPGGIGFAVGIGVLIVLLVVLLLVVA